MKILFVTPEIKLPLASGFSLRQWHVLEGLRKCGEVDVVTFQPPTRDPPAEVVRGCGRVVALPGQWLASTDAQRRMYGSTLGRCLLTLGTTKPFQFLGPRNDSLARWFADFVRRGGYDVIWVVRATTAAALGWRDPARTILDGDDFDHVREYMVLRSGAWYGAKVLDYCNILKLAWLERQLSRRFAYVVRCSDLDRDRMRGRNVAVIPNGASVPAALRRGQGGGLLFVGTLGYLPNEIGLSWFLRTVWPRVRRQAPGTELDVVGGRPAPWLVARNGQDGVRVHGFVEDLGPLYEKASFSIAPLLAGSGTRMKILESLAYSVPVVSTSVGAYGLELGPEEGVFRVDQPDQFADRCVELLGAGPRIDALGERGRQAVSAHYSWEKVHEKLKALVEEVCRRSHSRGHQKTAPQRLL
jgi:glycosyltransferase involved in cell wall biosynthesis